MTAVLPSLHALIVRAVEIAEEVQAKLLTLPEYKRANRISIYLSMPKGEILTQAIVLDALREGKRVFVPYIFETASINTHESKSVMTMVSIQSKEDYDSLRPDAWGIPTPDEITIERREVIGGIHGIDPDEDSNEIASKDGLDLVVMPGLAFDKRLKRLGHGKGYYDFFLQKLQQVTSPVGIDMPFLGKAIHRKDEALFFLTIIVRSWTGSERANSSNRAGHPG